MTRWNLDAPGFIACAAGRRRSPDRAGRGRGGRATRRRAALPLRTPSQRVRGSALRLLAAVSEIHQRPSLLRQAAGPLQEEAATATKYARLLCRPHRGLPRRRRTPPGPECSSSAPRHGKSAAPSRSPGPWYPQGRTTGQRARAAQRRRTPGGAAGRRGSHEPGDRHPACTSPSSTVEQHLTRVFRKLNVSGHARLPATLARIG